MPTDEANGVTRRPFDPVDRTVDSIEFSVVIPTADRPDDLLECIEALGEQTRRPKEVIIVNDGELSPDRVSRLEGTLGDVELEITSSDSSAIPGTGTARNTGKRLADGSIVVFLDDDARIRPTYLDRLYRLYRLHDAPDLAGIGGLLNGPDGAYPRHPYDLDRLFDRLFYQGTRRWRVNAAGYSARSYRPGTPPEALRKADWLAGSNMSFKRPIIADYDFPQWNPGREPAEDLMLGWKLSRDGYYCLVDPALPLEHGANHVQSGQSDVPTCVRIGRNRVRAFNQLGKKRYTPLFVWAVIGEALRELMIAVSDGQWDLHSRQAAGHLLGTVFQAIGVRPDDAVAKRLEGFVGRTEP